MATLTYVYAESSAVLGPLSPEQHPGGYDLCSEHSGELTVPKGWELVRLPGVDGTADEHEPDDIMALARAVREIGMLDDEVAPTDGAATADSHAVPDLRIDAARRPETGEDDETTRISSIRAE